MCCSSSASPTPSYSNIPHKISRRQRDVLSFLPLFFPMTAEQQRGSACMKVEGARKSVGHLQRIRMCIGCGGKNEECSCTTHCPGSAIQSTRVRASTLFYSSPAELTITLLTPRVRFAQPHQLSDQCTVLQSDPIIRRLRMCPHFKDSKTSSPYWRTYPQVSPQLLL